jgi:hypothetical protein
MTDLIELSELSVQYRIEKEHSVLALDKVTLDIPPGGYTIGVV